MADPHTSDPTPHRFERDQRPSEQLANVTFPLAVRGYDRRAVDDFVESVRGIVADLESRQTREGVVQKALDELGEETAGILQRAHETADEIASRSRAQADGRLQRAEREAELVKREADEYSEQVVADTRVLWEERQRLIEDLRHLADEVLGTADDALERLKLPDPLAVAEQEEEPTTAEDMAGPIPHPLSIAREPAPADDPGIPYDLDPPPPEQDPDATEAWPIDGEQDPDATQLYEFEPGAEDEDSGTVELEALPGGNAEEQQAAERERD
jgi:DivIVA domain-containing protein